MGQILMTIVLIMFCLAVDVDQTLPDDNVCNTRECIDVVYDINWDVNRSVDACDDFYQYACGRWIEEQYREQYSYKTRKGDLVLRKLRDLLAADPLDTDHSTVRKAKTLYKSCINDNLTAQVWSFHVWIVMNFGEWPMLCANCTTEFFFMHDALYTAALTGAHPLFSITVKPYVYTDAFGNTTEEVKIHIGKPVLGFEYSEYEIFIRRDTRSSIAFYADHIYQIARIFGIDRATSSDAVWVDARTIVEVEIELVKLYREHNENGSQELVTASWLIERFGLMIDWIYLMNKLAGVKNFDKNNATDETVVVTDPSFLATVLMYFSQLNIRTQINYIIWRVIDSLRSAEIHKETKLDNVIKRYLTAAGNLPVYWYLDTRCPVLVSKVFGYAVLRMMERVYAPPGKLQQALSKMQTVKEEFPLFLMDTGLIYEQSWRDAMRKVLNIHDLQLYKDMFDDDQALEDFYEKNKPVNTTLTLNVLLARMDAFVKNTKLLGKAHGINYRGEPEEAAYEIVVRYNPHINQAEYTAAIFQPPWFAPNVPIAISYAGIGFLYAQALMLGFISDHVQKHGTQQPNTTANDYEARINCFVEEYNQYVFTIANQTVNGTLTLFNNIADVAGLQLAYNAFMKASKAIGKHPSIRDMLYTPEQQFFVRFAQNFCEQMDVKKAIESLNSPYSPSKIRVNGAVSHSADFSKAFNCPVGSNMNPAQKCHL
ncbi:hypothetical protein BsWGS_17218 [Bradybaena similaris]